MSGTPVSWASATAGQRFATAVPEVTITATGGRCPWRGRAP